VSAAKLSGVALVDEKVEHARSLLEFVANRHRVLVLLRGEAIGFVEDQAKHVGTTFDALLVERTHNAGEQHIAARARGDGLPHLREKGRHEVAFGRLLRLAVRKFCHVHRERSPRIGLDELTPAEGLANATVAFDPEGVATHLDACSGGTGEALAGTGENQGPLVAKKRMDFRGRHCRGLHAEEERSRMRDVIDQRRRKETLPPRGANPSSVRAAPLRAGSGVFAFGTRPEATSSAAQRRCRAASRTSVWNASIRSAMPFQRCPRLLRHRCARRRSSSECGVSAYGGNVLSSRYGWP